LSADGKVLTKAVYSVLGVNLRREKEVLGLYVGDNESSRFWLQVLTDLSERGVQDILIASIDNLRGFAEAIETIFPRTDVQLCIVHQIRNTLKYVNWKNYKNLLQDLKKIYQAGTEELVRHHFEEFKSKWGDKYQKGVKSWEDNWVRLTSYFKYPKAVRKLVYLATLQFQKRWENGIYSWQTILNQLLIYFEDRIN